jgi:hypothetical protein
MSRVFSGPRPESYILPNVLPQDIARFLSHVEVEDGCWVWQGGKDRNGYGKFSWRAVDYYAHRWAFIVFVNGLPGDEVLHHTCRNPSCVNPMHLETMSNADNVAEGNRRRAEQVPF